MGIVDRHTGRRTVGRKIHLANGWPGIVPRLALGRPLRIALRLRFGRLLPIGGLGSTAVIVRHTVLQECLTAANAGIGHDRFRSLGRARERGVRAAVETCLGRCDRPAP
jgi:hypothetical protein